MKPYIYALCICGFVALLAVLCVKLPVPEPKTVQYVVSDVGSIKPLPKVKSTHVGPDYLYPDLKLTPGKVATQDFKELTSTEGGTYSQRHRQTTAAMKHKVCAEYNLCGKAIEIDHFVPLAAGGADDVANLWAEPEHSMWDGQDFGFHTKDRLESYMVLQLKRGKISPEEVDKCFLVDWVACYLANFTK